MEGDDAMDGGSLSSYNMAVTEGHRSYAHLYFCVTNVQGVHDYTYYTCTHTHAHAHTNVILPHFLGI